jgi:hypothetical protein
MSAVVGKLAVEIGVTDDQLQAGLNKAAGAAQQAGQKIQQSMTKAAQSVSAASNAAGNGFKAGGLLQVSRAIDDVQYGFRGVINNIEGIVTGLGGSAGMAGAATIAAVAISAIAPKIYEAVTAATPLTKLLKEMESISKSGLEGSFAGVAAQAKVMEEAIEATLEKMQKMERASQKVVFSGAGPGMGAAPVSQQVGSTHTEMIEQQQLLNTLIADSAKATTQAKLEQTRISASGLAAFDKTTAEKEQQEVNKKIYQAAVDKYGGGEAVAKRLDFMDEYHGKETYGGFKEGDIQASQKAIEMLGMAAEKTKILAEEFERATGSAEELARIETQKQNQENKKIGQEFDQMVKDELERQNLQKKTGTVQQRLDDLMSQRARSEVVGMSSVFEKNLNAGMEDPVVKAIEKQTEELKQITRELATLG